MRFEAVVDKEYPHPIDEVWAALTSPSALAGWLMETRGFVAEVGCAFEMSCLDEQGHEDVYRCEVLEIERPARMVWSWVLAERESQGSTRVEFILDETARGTRLTVRHSGDRDRETIERFEAGWPSKLDSLEGVLGTCQ